MNQEDYRSACLAPDALSRGVLQTTASALKAIHPASWSRVNRILNNPPITKPALHSGDTTTDYFKIDLSCSEAEQIVEYLVDLEASTVDSRGDATPEAITYADLVNTWLKYIDYCDEVEG